METVLQVTLCGNGNFGNKLQAIALKRMIEDANYNVSLASYGFPTAYKTRVKHHIMLALGKMGLKKYRKAYLNSCREKAISLSSKKYLEKETKKTLCFNQDNAIQADLYSAAITGSDQVWHGWYNNPNELSFFYLDYMPKEKRISYAASFGFDKFPEKDKEAHERGLKGMHYISCREETGCELVRQATGTPGELVLDPTLCVDRLYWEAMEEKPDFIHNEKYLLLFMLGSSKSYISKIEQYATDYDLRIINLYDYSKPRVWKTTIGGFVWLIHHAEIICTDSFHCTAFAIMFQKKITVYKRIEREMGTMFNRLETLLKIVNMEQVIYSGDSIVDTVPDYSVVGSRLRPYIEKSRQWLFSALKKVIMDN